MLVVIAKKTLVTTKCQYHISSITNSPCIYLCSAAKVAEILNND